MQNGLDMGGNSSKTKFIVIGVMVVIFGAAGYYATSSSSTPPKKVAKAAPKPDVSADATPAPPPVAEAEPAPAPAPEPLPVAPPPKAARHATPAPAPEVAAMPEPSYNPPAESRPARHSAPAKSSAPETVEAAPRGADALEAWWQPGSPADFKVLYVGQAAGQNALVVRFSKDLADAGSVAQKIELIGPGGTAASGTWTFGANHYVLVQTGLSPGRYIVKFDPGLTSASGAALGSKLSGPIYIQ